MLGFQPGNTILQHPTHRKERAENHDSISGLCSFDSSLQSRHGVWMAAGCYIVAFVRQHLHGIPPGLQISGLLGARRGQIGEVPAIDQRPDLAQHGGQVLVVHSTKDGMRDREITHGVQIGGERRNGMRVVPHIQHQRGLARHDLETPRQLDHRQAVAHRLGCDR
ncbi:hypothetical protein D3C72_1237620 [compost metagenome]